MYFVFYKILYKIQHGTMANIFSNTTKFNQYCFDVKAIASRMIRLTDCSPFRRGIRHQNVGLFCIFCLKNKIQIHQNVFQIQNTNMYFKYVFQILYLKYYPALHTLIVKRVDRSIFIAYNSPTFAI